MPLSGSEKKVVVAIYQFFLLKSTRQKSAYLEPFIGYLALVVGYLWQKLDDGSEKRHFSSCL